MLQREGERLARRTSGATKPGEPEKSESVHFRSTGGGAASVSSTVFGEVSRGPEACELGVGLRLSFDMRSAYSALMSVTGGAIAHSPKSHSLTASTTCETGPAKERK